MNKRQRKPTPVEFASHHFELPGGPALWWPAQRAIVVADVHLGKGAAFRSAGVPVPAGSSLRDLERLKRLVTDSAARQLIILGDFFHARSGNHPELMDEICQWRRKLGEISVMLIRGNHDQRAGHCPGDWEIDERCGPVEIDGLFLSHFPDEADCRPLMAGHVHPVCAVRDFDHSYARLPCFVFDQDVAILPAFGTFTGGSYTPSREGRRLFAVAGEMVIRMTVHE
jgi:DNA ligase-associated metallophosphoesterase